MSREITLFEKVKRIVYEYDAKTQATTSEFNDNNLPTLINAFDFYHLRIGVKGLIVGNMDNPARAVEEILKFLESYNE